MWASGCAFEFEVDFEGLHTIMTNHAGVTQKGTDGNLTVSFHYL